MEHETWFIMRWLICEHMLMMLPVEGKWIDRRRVCRPLFHVLCRRGKSMTGQMGGWPANTWRITTDHQGTNSLASSLKWTADARVLNCAILCIDFINMAERVFFSYPPRLLKTVMKAPRGRTRVYKRQDSTWQVTVHQSAVTEINLDPEGLIDGTRVGTSKSIQRTPPLPPWDSTTRGPHFSFSM